MHAQGIVHRDIKPDNLLLNADQVLKIVDFGVSEIFTKDDDRLKSSNGSPAFTSPELLQVGMNNVSGRAADIWAMGVTLYALVYGILPFHNPNVLELYENIRSMEYESWKTRFNNYLGYLFLKMKIRILWICFIGFLIKIQIPGLKCLN